MLQIIGLIVAIYAMARMVQVPLEMSAGTDLRLGVPLWVRFGIVAGISLAAIVILALLTLTLLMSGSPTTPRGLVMPN